MEIMASLQRQSRPTLIMTFILTAAVAPVIFARAQTPKEAVPVESLRVENRTSETRVVIDLGAPVHLSYEKVSSPDRLYMYLWHTQPGPKLKYGRRSVNTPRLSATTIDEWAIGTRVGLHLKPGASYTIIPATRPPRIVVVLRHY
jgi:hypothetical protein